jgi:hypothetical protein
MAAQVRVDIVRFVDDAQPGFVECRLIDAWGHEWSFVDKVPIFTCEDLWSDSSYPYPGFIACEIIERKLGPDAREVVTIDTEKPFDVEATEGGYRFDVLPEQLECED